MKILRKVQAVGAFLLLPWIIGCDDAAAESIEMTVYATPTCGCCKAWIEHAKQNGFAVNVVYRDDLSSIKAEHKLPAGLTSCHTAVVGDYAFEGHVPADVVKRFLTERPAVLGLAVPGMPMGSPGMEVESGQAQPYEVYSFTEAGPEEVYEYRN